MEENNTAVATKAKPKYEEAAENTLHQQLRLFIRAGEGV